MADQRTEEPGEAEGNARWRSRAESRVLQSRCLSRRDQGRIPEPAHRKRIELLAKEARQAFGALIREARLRLGITQEALGVVIGLTSRGQSYISQIELGHINLTIESLVLVSEALGFELDLVLRKRQVGTAGDAQSEIAVSSQ